MRRPFSKWDPDATPREPTPEEMEEARKQAFKAFLLRWAWLIASAFAAFGYVIVALALTDKCDLIHLNC